ncbi:P1 family peptidase [Krasilnikovia sp. MM14-A1004]|uniref:DmpA family aminopeptidase n=1 Tax=Krasilnikovia sp. MM14-A1004 TaxID=3373541 RepID=UPI00399C5B01
MRARDLGPGPGWGPPGHANAITDVPGVRVGHTTLIAEPGVRTGVTVLLPRPAKIFHHPVFAGCHRLNGNGELTGLEWIRETGLLSTPIALTNTHSVGVVRDALVAWEIEQRGPDAEFWSLPVVGETWDGRLNDINGQHVRPEHVLAALAGARPGRVVEGNVGGGTGTICHGFKAGIGTASRVVTDEHGSFVLGVLVQANHGSRARFTVGGIPVGELVGPDVVPLPGPGARPEGAGSIIGVIATDAPLLPHQCARLARRAPLGLARLGAVGEHHSGDLFLAFATGNAGLTGDHDRGPSEHRIRMLADSRITALFSAVVDATEEAVLNAMLAARTMTGRAGVVAHALPPAVLTEALAGVRRR